MKKRKKKWKRWKRGERDGGRSIDPFASSSRKQVSPRKTGLIRKILIFIHTRRGGGGNGGSGGGGRPGGKAFSKSPGGRKVDGGITLFYKAKPAGCAYVYLCTEGASFKAHAQVFITAAGAANKLGG